VEKARNVDNLTVDFSGTHSQPDDADYMVSAPDIFGTEAMAENIKALKKKMDRNNRFRFHPFAKLI
jgi:hypothetical protein